MSGGAGESGPSTGRAWRPAGDPAARRNEGRPGTLSGGPGVTCRAACDVRPKLDAAVRARRGNPAAHSRLGAKSILALMYLNW